MPMNSMRYCLLGSLVAGCAAAPDFAATEPSNEGVAHVQKTGDTSFHLDVNNSTGEQYREIDHEVLRELVQVEVAEFAKPGARVAVTVGDGPDITGTVHKRTRDHLELYNCIARVPVPGPDGQMQCQTTHTPLQSIPIEKLTRLTQIEPPPKDYRAPESTDEITAIGVIFRDGHQQQWSRVRPAE